MFQRIKPFFNPGFKALQKNMTSMTFSSSKKKGDELKKDVDDSFKLKNSSEHFLKKGDQLISYNYLNQEENPDHIDKNRFFASSLNLKHRFYYEKENEKKVNPHSIVFSEVKEDVHCTRGLREKGGHELETFVVESDQLEPKTVLKPK